MSEWKRRILDRTEAKCLELELQLLQHLNKYGTANFQLTIGLAHSYVRRARERVKRKCATKEDIEILKQYGYKE